LASILENWRQKIKIGDFFGSNIFGARATRHNKITNKIIYYSLHLGGNEREITVFGKDKI
jgi:hypothetical protein